MIQRIKARNVRTIKELDLELPPVKTISFVGRKGSGKSSLLETIALAYYGQGRTKNIQTIGSEDRYEVELHELVDSVPRSLKRTDKKAGQRFWFQVGETEYKSDKVTESQPQFDQIIGCNSEIFFNAYFFVQGDSDELFTARSTGRMELLRKIFNYELFKLWHKNTKAKCDALKKSQESLKDKIADLQENIFNETLVANAKFANENLEKTKVKKQEELEKLQAELAQQPNLSQYEEAKLKVKSFKDGVADLETQIGDYFEGKEIPDEISLEAIEANAETVGKELEAKTKEISKLETKRSEISYKMKSVKENLKQIEVHKDVCPTCKRAGWDEYGRKQTQYSTELKALETELADFINKINSAETEKGSIDAQVSDLKKHRTMAKMIERKEKLDRLKAELEKVNDVIGKFESSVALVAHLEENIAGAKKEIELCITGIAQNNAEIQRAEAGWKKLETYYAEVEKLNTDYQEELIVLEAFSNGGAPKMMIDKVLPAWESKANAICSQIDFKHTIEIDSDDEAIEFYAVNSLGKKSYADLSGGEKSQFVFSIRLALTQILIEMFSVPYRTIFLDEVFGTIDAETREQTTRMIKMLENYFEQIFIISHNEDQDIAEAVFNVEIGEDGFTRVSR